MTGPLVLVDPELRSNPVLLETRALNLDDLPLARQMYLRMADVAVPAYEGLNERSIYIDGPAGPASLRLYLVEPATSPARRPLLFHIHGGGYVMGAPEVCRADLLMLSHSLGISVLSVDYRLAPEAPHPAPVEDCYAALKWGFEHADELGIDRDRIAVTGESAGGGLAAALCLLARDRGEISICFQRLIYPMLDDRTCSLDQPHPHTGLFVWSRGSNRLGWSSLLGMEPGGSNISHYAAAARADDLRGLPPTYIDVGALDLFLEESLEYARRLTRAGVAVEFHVFPGAYHGFDYMAARDTPTPQVVKAQQRINHDALRRALFG